MPGFHTCVIRTHSGAPMSSDIWAPMLTNNPSRRNKSLRARLKVTHVELFRRHARLVPRYIATATYGNWNAQGAENIFCSPEKRARLGNNFITTFGKSLFITHYRMRYAMYIPLNAKDLTIDLTMHAYGNRQIAIKFARANNSDLLQALKHFMETVWCIDTIFIELAVTVIN